ncbi:sushi, von Willebrand factor type A, EGF and pentraxin domain-containing protein 1-like [Hydractinia symbiolongicarpus]|uniref:sushi, von Willebrand factor type A, EGF and pentraxin domain-containing protein 1-like n=1 Tax=Hydractinia symbiolongicarpus TaxID=13093 RepID=UPI00255003B2|nr:sushi, von Willebrand factor type A, EGF and pentraxin domain-containing protein 1-like [Hydractinia symbiolongicarpus]
MFYVKVTFLLLALRIWLHAASDERCGIDRAFTVIHESSQIDGVVYSYISDTIAHCIIKCVKHVRCKSINFNHLTRECQLSSLYSKMTTLTKQANWVHMETDPYKKYQGKNCIENSNQCENHDYCRSLCRPPWYECMCINEKYGKSCNRNPCKNSGTCVNACFSPGYTCVCPALFVGERCEHYGIHFVIHFIGPSKQHAITNINFSPISGVSVCFWFRDEGVDTVWRAVVNLLQNGGKCNFFTVAVKYNKFKIGLFAEHYQLNTVVEKNKWYHVCAIYDLSTLSGLLYVNGEYVETVMGPVMTNNQFYANGVVLGQDVDLSGGACVVNDINQGFIGYITLVNIWSRRLSVTEVRDTYLQNIPFGDLRWDELLTFHETGDIKKVLFSPNFTIH